jgi:isocitrate dehydrogenase
LPNISASVPQLALQQLRSCKQKDLIFLLTQQRRKLMRKKLIQLKYNKVKGSAVNPVLREGNSDRRAPKAVKNYAKVNPHSMGEWSKDSKTHVATMCEGDFHHNEKSVCLNNATDVKMNSHHAADGTITTILKESTPLLANEIIDASVMSKKALLSFLEKEINDAKDTGILLSLHMKATMMKVSDPIIFRML